MIVAECGTDEIDLDEVLLEVLASGAWEAERARLARGLVGLGRGVGRDALRAAEVTFRRERGLHAAEDLRSWLEVRGLDVGDLRAHLRLMLAAAGANDESTTEEGLRDAARVAVTLDGLAAAAVRRLLLGAAALELLDPPAPQPRSSDATTLARQAAEDPALPLDISDVTALEPLATAVLCRRLALQAAHQRVENREIEETLAQHSIDWTRYEFGELVVASRSAAREVVLCMSEDGLDLASAGELAGGRYTERVCRAVETAPALRAQLLAGEPGTPLGPLEVPDGWRVVVVGRRQIPDAEDEAAWEQAREIAVEAWLGRRLAGRVKWHVEL